LQVNNRIIGIGFAHFHQHLVHPTEKNDLRNWNYSKFKHTSKSMYWSTDFCRNFACFSWDNLQNFTRKLNGLS